MPEFISLNKPDSYHTVHEFNQFFNIKNRHPDISFLTEIIRHFSSLPYENISKIIKNKDGDAERIRLPEEIFHDHLQDNLGGTCFSLTYFLFTILTSHGFSCYPVMADMKYGRNSHCALIVKSARKRYLIDPGYLLNNPMPIDPAEARIFHSEVTGVELQFLDDTRYIDLYTFNSLEKKWRYRLRDIPVTMEAFLHFWRSSVKWNSMNSLCLNRIEDGCMTYIHRTHMRKVSGDFRKNFKIKQNLHSVIQSHFGIRPEKVEEALSAIESRKNRKIVTVHPEALGDNP